MGRREKPLDPADGTVPAFAHELRKLRADAGTPTYRAMARRAGYSGPTLSAAASGERLPTLAVLLAYVTACGGDTAEWEKRWHEAAAERADAPGQDGADSPYPGLARFEPADHDRFHGRDDLIAELLALTGRARFSAIVGASGSGKSSLLRAGLIPALRQETSGAAVSPGTGREEAGAPGSPGVPPGGGRGLPRPSLVPAAIRILTPGAHPDRTPDALFVPHDAPGDTLLVVDQFEEVFTLCADPGERARFIDRLLTALEPDSGLRVIIGVRADFYGRCADHGRLAEALRESTLLVGPMTPQRLREAVVRPAAARRVVVERALTARIVADVTGEPGGLPLMAHALRETWRRRSARTLTLTAYESVGGVQGAVAHTAEEVYGLCTPAEAVAVRALLLRLVHPGDGAEDTRRPVRRDELGDTAPTGRLLERLVAARLLTVDGDTVELAHEALISAWPRLHGWLDEDRERLRTHRRLTEAAGVWRELGRERGALYRGVRLTEAREEFGTRQGELSTLERDFLAASVAAYEHGRRAAARAARRLRALTAGLAVLLCLAVVAGVFAWRQSGVSERQRDEAEARRVAAFADTLRPTDPRTAMRLALAAWRTADLPETREALRAAAGQSEQDAFTQPVRDRATNAPSWLSRDGRQLTTVVRDQIVQWDVRTHRRTRAVTLPGLSWGIVDVSPDGRRIVYRERRGGAVVRDLATHAVHRVAPGDWTDTDAAFGPDGRTLVVRRPERDTGGRRATVEVWDARRQRVLFRHRDGDPDGPLPVLSRDGRLLARCTHDGAELRVWDVVERHRIATDVPARTARLLCGSDEPVFTPDNRALAAGTDEGVVTWDFRAGRARPLLPTPGAAVHAVEFDPTGGYALTWSPGALALWRTDAPAPADGGPRQPLITFPVGTPAVTDIRLDPREGVLRYREGSSGAGVVHTLRLHGLVGPAWRTSPAADAAFDAHGEPAVPAQDHAARAVAADGSVHIAVGVRDGIRVVRQGTRPGARTVRTGDDDPRAIAPSGRTVLTAEGVLIDVASGGRRKGFGGEDLLRTAAFSADGRLVAVADQQGRLTLWDGDGRHRIAVLTAAGPTVDPPVLAFSWDGSLLAASTSDGSVRVWETASPRLRGAELPVGDGPVLALGFTSDSRELRVATPHLGSRTVELAPARAASAVCARAGGGPTRDQWRAHLPDVPFRRTC
ncbi:hypothetical protein [Streptomyces sp. Tue6028]|uniref:nSTAND1 domain-containing NTPase n=1 Tax=Streptomyces sp. Tue6028 TaxID=2036037 RepID=UPI003D72D13F